MKVLRSAFALAVAGASISVAAAPAIASPTSDASSVQGLIKGVSSASNPSQAWNNLSTQQKDLISKEINGGSFEATLSKAPILPAAYTGCWTRTSQNIYKGGITRTSMFGVSQTITTCSKAGKVTRITVNDRHTLKYAYPGVSTTNLNGATLNVGWEGRAISRVDGGVGAVISGHEIGAFKTVCTALYMNGNGHDIRITADCELQH